MDFHTIIKNKHPYGGFPVQRTMDQCIHDKLHQTDVWDLQLSGCVEILLHLDGAQVAAEEGHDRVVLMQQVSLHLILRHLVKQRLIGDQQPRVSIPHHKGKPLRRIGGVQGLIGRSGLQDTQRCRCHVGISRNEHGNHAAPPDAHVSQMARDALGNVVNLGIGQNLVLEDDRGALGVFLRAFSEQRDDVCHGIVRPGGVEAIQPLCCLAVDQPDVCQSVSAQHFRQYPLVYMQEFAGKVLRVQGFLIVKIISDCTVMRVHLELKAGLGIVQIHIGPFAGQAAEGIRVADDLSLIGKNKIRTDAQFPAHLFEGIHIIGQAVQLEQKNP